MIAKRSFVTAQPPDKLTCAPPMVFTPGLGFHRATPGIAVLYGKRSTMFHDDTFLEIVGINRKGSGACEIEIEKRRRALEYTQDLMRLTKAVPRVHRPLNLTPTQMVDLEQFFLFVSMFTNSKWYSMITMTNKGGNSSMPKPDFYRLPFQQLMMLDTFFMMIERYGFGDLREFILLYVRNNFGLNHITPAQAKMISERFDTRMAGFIIPRRCGKSTFVETLITATMVFCGAGGLKILYTAHKLSIVTKMYNDVRQHSPKLCETFNSVQRAKYMERKQKNLGHPIPYDFYYHVEMTPRTKEGSIEMFFFKKNSEGLMNGGTACSTNSLICRVYKSQNALRGETFNVMYVDETNFIPPSIYQELIPMLSTGKARMIMMSSHKAGQDNKDFVDLSSVRMNEMLMCNVSYVCAEHCLALIRNEDMTITRCFCNFFTQPLHINTDAGYKKFTAAFSVKTSYKNGTAEADKTQRKIALLSEIGVLPPGITEEDLANVDVNMIKLSSDAGKKHMMTNSVVVEEYIGAQKKPNATMCDFVVVYIDPAPTDTERSYHAMTFVGRLDVIDPSNTRETHRYVILWVEEFSTDQFAKDAEYAYALAAVFMRSCVAISRLYSNYFKTFYVIPEANSISLDRFQYHCARMESCLQELAQFGVIILTAVMRVGVKRRAKEEERNAKAKKKMDDDYVRRQKELGGATTSQQIDYSTLYSVNGAKLQKVMQSSMLYYEIQNERHKQELHDLRSAQYRIGYSLGVDKFERFSKFFSAFYNKSDQNINDITCAFNVSSFFLQGKEVSIPAYIAQKMVELSIRRRHNARGVASYTISGKASKGSGKWQHLQDDLAVTIICSTTLFEDIASRKFKGEFMRLEVM